MGKKKHISKNDIAYENYIKGYNIISNHPMFAPLIYHVHYVRHEGNLCPEKGWAVITENGYLHVHPTRRGDPHEWAYVIAHCLLHLGLGHFQEKADNIKWNTACDCFIAKFLYDMKLGRVPSEMQFKIDFAVPSEEKLYNEFVERGIPSSLTVFGTAGENFGDMIMSATNTTRYEHKVDWIACFARGLSMAVTSAVNVAAGYEPFLGADKKCLTTAVKAKNWFINSYPLLGALAASFTIIEDTVVCARMDISVAAVNEYMREIYINPAAGLDEYECRFVIAHELLHVGLRHHSRCQGRDPYLWNIACDYVINGWLVEMGLGELPKIGTLYDPDLKGLSAEAIYDRIVLDFRKFRKLATLRGIGLGDILEKVPPDWRAIDDGITLDEFYRRSLGQGLSYHEEQGRGYLPAGLIEEIRALSQPPVPWDVELAQWFDNYFSPLEKVRSYVRPSRRQASTPDIPRPRWVPAAGSEDGRTYGVILDTSGSMDRILLAKALGAIASYSISRDVPYVRVVFCDAAVYDQGYMAPEAIADRVKVKGRGGTILQPGIDLLEKAEDFPKNGPLLIITDGYCEPLRIHREHAFLIPKGSNLPFIPKGKVFRFS
ncbi:MAG TPA: VWA-like domain-containing protein [Pseudobacteroides sp.]|nr:VWA-like domain-containing protein [Pseudobacteroides sp.]